MTTRRKRNVVDHILADSASAVCVLDSERRIRLFNHGMSARTGWSSDDVEGMTCQPATSETSQPLELLASALSPSQDVLSGQQVTVDTILPRPNASLYRARLTFIPIADTESAVTRVLIVCEDAPPGTTATSPLSQRLHAEITALRVLFRKRYGEGTFVGRSPLVQLAIEKADILRNATCGYCISGQSGTGRRHLARLIHATGNIADTSFVALDCRLLLAEQVLDAVRRMRRQQSEHAARHQRVGTLLLVDADRCPGEVQQWILENMSREFHDIRLAATSTSPLASSPSDNWLRPEFCQMLTTVQIELPDLHHRGDDVLLLAQHFTEECHRTLSTSAETLAPETQEELRFYRWPGNVRELRNVMTEACQNSFELSVTPEDLPFSFRAGLDAQSLLPEPAESGQSLDDILTEFERDVLTQTLESCGGNKAAAARRLGMTRPKFYRRLTALGLEDDRAEQPE